MILIRKILFYLFLLIYLLLCPLLILYSFGYIFNPVNKQVSQTGLIHLSTAPSGAHVYLGKSHYKYKTPTSITELLPGTYQVNLKLKGYRPWKHKISVKAGESETFENILLIPERLMSYRLSYDANYNNLISLPDKYSLLVQKGSRLEDFYFFDWKKEKLTPLVNEDSPYHNFPVISIFEPKESVALIAYGGSLWERKYLLIDLQNKSETIKDITRLFSDKPILITGSQENKNIIFALYKSHINQLDIVSMSLYPKYIEDVKGFGLSGRWLYILGKDNVISKMTLGKEQGTALFEDGSIPESLFNNSRFYRIQVLENDIFLFWGDKGDLITMIPPYDIAKGEVSGLDFLKQKKQLMYWTKDGIWIVEFSSEDKQESLSTDRIRSRSVYEEGKYISQCYWAYNGTHVIFRDKDKVFLLELAPDGKHHIEHILNVRHDSDIFYSEENRHLYYLDQQGSLVKIDIGPEVEK